MYPNLNRKRANWIVIGLTILSCIECFTISFYWITLTIFDRKNICPSWFYSFGQTNYGFQLTLTYLQGLFMLKVIYFIGQEWQTDDATSAD